MNAQELEGTSRRSETLCIDNANDPIADEVTFFFFFTVEKKNDARADV